LKHFIGTRVGPEYDEYHIVGWNQNSGGTRHPRAGAAFIHVLATTHTHYGEVILTTRRDRQVNAFCLQNRPDGPLPLSQTHRICCLFMGGPMIIHKNQIDRAQLRTANMAGKFLRRREVVHRGQVDVLTLPQMSIKAGWLISRLAGKSRRGKITLFCRVKTGVASCGATPLYGVHASPWRRFGFPAGISF
jgi:hypothetical protein